jgi:acyl carrier protein
MTHDQALDAVRTVLGEIAPEADLGAVPGDRPLQEGLDLDSIDFLNFVEGLHDLTGVEIPEHDYPRISTLDGCLDYLVEATS